MRFFLPGNRTRDAQSERLYAWYELVYTGVDFAAAIQFVIGSLLFFDEQTVTAGTWLFLTGSICFALRPSVHFAREVHYWRRGRIRELAEIASD